MEELNIDNLDMGPSSNNLGIDFLMNTQKIGSERSTKNIDFDNSSLDDLEKRLTDDKYSRSHSPMGGVFKLGGDNFNADLGRETSSLSDNAGPKSTWDGFGKINDANLASASTAEAKPGMFSSWFGGNTNSSGGTGNNSGSGSAPQSQRDRIRDKKRMLRKLNEWREKGLIRGDNMFTMETPLEEVEDEYEACLEDKRRKDSIKLQKWWLISAVNTIEYTNSRFDPFDVSLDGWGEQINDDIESYEDVLSELYDKYKGGKLAPEVTLLLKMVFSAIMVNITNKALSSAVPSVNDIIRQSPDLLRAFTSSAAENMSRQNPDNSAAGFMNSVLSSNIRPPPAISTQGPNATPPPPRPGTIGLGSNTVRPDIQAARESRPMFQEKGVDLNRTSAEFGWDSGTGSMDFGGRSLSNPSETSVRREMTGPERTQRTAPSIDEMLQTYDPMPRDIDSSISIASLKEIQATTKPKTNRKRKSPSNSNRMENVISLTQETSLSL